jgi:hypothetical protein
MPTSLQRPELRDRAVAWNHLNRMPVQLRPSTSAHGPFQDVGAHDRVAAMKPTLLFALAIAFAVGIGATAVHHVQKPPVISTQPRPGVAAH